jgi:glutathionyl-hydroquinone reductase
MLTFGGCDTFSAWWRAQLYEKSSDTHGKYTVPVLWDKKTGTIVNNESAEIVRMFNRFVIGALCHSHCQPLNPFMLFSLLVDQQRVQPLRQEPGPRSVP